MTTVDQTTHFMRGVASSDVLADTRVVRLGRTMSFSSVDCTVRNISSSGARIDVAIPIRLPQPFTLIIEADQFMRHCHPVWSGNQRIGVAFDRG